MTRGFGLRDGWAGAMTIKKGNHIDCPNRLIRPGSRKHIISRRGQLVNVIVFLARYDTGWYTLYLPAAFPKQKRRTKTKVRRKVAKQKLLELFRHQRKLQLRLRQRLHYQAFRGLRRRISRCRHLAHQQILGALQHFLFAEGKRLAPAERNEALEDYGYFQEGTRAHALGIFFEPVLPVVVRIQLALLQESQHLGRIVGSNDCSQSDRF